MGGILEECARITNLRDEHRVVAATIAVAGQSTATELQKLIDYPTIEANRHQGYLHTASQLYSRVLPNAGVFVCPIEEGVPAPTQPLRYSALKATGFFTLKEVSARFAYLSKLAIFSAEGSLRVVRVHSDNRWSGDYYVNEKRGVWQLRTRTTLEAALSRYWPKAQTTPLKRIADLFCDLIIPYSYEGHGALFIFNETSFEDLYDEPGFRVNLPTEHLDLATFTSIASVDGATWIDFQGTIKEAGIILEDPKPDGSESRRPMTLAIPDANPSITQPPLSSQAFPPFEGPDEGGARHRAARNAAEHLVDGLIVGVSANREITLLRSDLVKINKLRF